MESKSSFWKVFLTFSAIILPWVFAYFIYNRSHNPNTGRKTGSCIDSTSEIQVSRTVPVKKNKGKASDHSKFEVLQKEFKSPQELTAACLSCHNTTDIEIMRSSHWTWTRPVRGEKGDTAHYGKKNLINNFCIGLASNEARCTSCHIGFGWEDDKFDFTDGKNIDCIICHDQTKTYKKFPTMAGYPVSAETEFEGKKFSPPDYNLIAKNVGKPTRENCGTCHYYGGGGNNVKHGDMEKELSKTTKEVDVHMGIDGANMQCIDCHTTEEHNISGNLYSVAFDDKDNTTCQSCHYEKPHKNEQINLHSNKVSCQACHIPEYAKVNPTKMEWDWGQAGQRNSDGSMIVKKDSAGNVVYHTMKGAFVWGKNVKPEYVWFNGHADHYINGDKIDTNIVVKLNPLSGSYEDPKAKLFPVKVHRAKHIYDTENNIIISPHLFGKDSSAFWSNFNWDKAAASGMKSINLPYSGKYGFVKTEMYWPVNHMVSKASEALTCVECHSPDGRLKNLTGFYLVGRNSVKAVDFMGISLIIVSLIGVFVHAMLRVFKSKN